MCGKMHSVNTQTRIVRNDCRADGTIFGRGKSKRTPNV